MSIDTRNPGTGTPAEIAGLPTDIVEPNERLAAVRSHFDQFKANVKPEKGWNSVSVMQTVETDGGAETDGVWNQVWMRYPNGREELTYERQIDHGRESYSLVIDKDGESNVTMGYYFGLSEEVRWRTWVYKPNFRGLLERVDQVGSILRPTSSGQSDVDPANPGHDEPL